MCFSLYRRDVKDAHESIAPVVTTDFLVVELRRWEGARTRGREDGLHCVACGVLSVTCGFQRVGA